MPHDCERWQFEVWLEPDLAEESRYWSDGKREAYEIVKGRLVERLILAHLCSPLSAACTTIPTDYGLVKFSIRIDGSIIRCVISKFYYSNPDDPGPDGGHFNAPIDGLVLIVFGSARSYRTMDISHNKRYVFLRRRDLMV